MNLLDSQVTQNLLIAIVFIGGIILYVKSRQPAQTLKNYKDLVESQDKRIKALEDQRLEDQRQHVENIKAIADLQGQVKVYKELPLKELAEGMKRNNELSNKNNELSTSILETLKGSAITLVQDTKEAATHVSEVRQDLRSAS